MSIETLKVNKEQSSPAGPACPTQPIPASRPIRPSPAQPGRPSLPSPGEKSKETPVIVLKRQDLTRIHRVHAEAANLVRMQDVGLVQEALAAYFKDTDKLIQACKEDLGIAGITIHPAVFAVLEKFVPQKIIEQIKEQLENETIRQRSPLDPRTAGRLLLQCIRSQNERMGEGSAAMGRHLTQIIQTMRSKFRMELKDMLIKEKLAEDQVKMLCLMIDKSIGEILNAITVKKSQTQDSENGEDGNRE